MLYGLIHGDDGGVTYGQDESLFMTQSIGAKIISEHVLAPV